MAVVTVVLCRIEEGALNARLEVDCDDATDPNNYDLIAGRCVNGLTRPVFFWIHRANRAPWVAFEVAAGQTRNQNAGGQIRKLNDIPTVALRT